MRINFKYVGHKNYEYEPKHATEGASGCDLINASGVDILIPSGCIEDVPTGVCVEIPEGREGQLRPRSGFSRRTLLDMKPSIGTIDSDYRGEIKACFYNPTNTLKRIKAGERIAQLVIAPYERCEYNKKAELSDTERGSGGFGSTGE